MKRLLAAGLILLWINLNYTLFPALIFLGWCNLGTEDNTVGWWMIAAGSIPILIYFVFIFLDGMIDKSLMIANAGRSSPAPAGSIAGSLFFVFGVHIFFTWLLFAPLIGILGGETPSCLAQHSSGHLSTTCHLLWWPGWFY